MKIIKNSKQEIYGLTYEQRDTIKEALTFDNPAYKNAKRYSKYRYISIPPYLTYYSEKSVKDESGERKKVLIVPIGVNVNKLLNVPYIDSEDGRTSKPVKYPPFKLELREDQKKAEREYISETNYAIYPKSIIQLPTGKGKSILALHIAQRLKQKTLILVHKDDLVVGWTKDIKLCFGDDFEIGLIKAKSRKVGKQITIATVQTLSRMTDEELSKYLDQFGLVVQDECHHVGLNIFNIIDKFNSKYKLGLSATPTRTDGLTFVFNLFFSGLCYKHEITEDDTDICSVWVFPIDSDVRYKPFIYQGEILNYYDYDVDELPDEIDFVEDFPYESRPTVPHLVVDDSAVSNDLTLHKVSDLIVKEYLKGHSILVLFTQKKHIDLYYAYLRERIPEKQIMRYYGDSSESSEKLMKKAEDKEVLVTLATYAKASEGTNVKSWEVEFLVSSINNSKGVEQVTGRIRRRKDGKLNPVKVYDIRYPQCYGLKRHYATRLATYKKLLYKITDPLATGKKSLFTRGYN